MDADKAAQVKQSLEAILEVAKIASTWKPSEQWQAWATLERIKQIAERGLR